MKNLVCVVLLVTEVYSANVKRQFQGCIYEGRTYQQGETWQKTCELNCVCQDASSGRYQCNNICPTYSDLPPSCSLVKAPGECCAKPQCNFQPVGTGSGSGSGLSSGSGSGSGLSSGSGSGSFPGSCRDQIQNCNGYGTSVCRDSSYAKWVEDNCCSYCRSITGGTTGTMTGGTGPMTGGTGTMTGGTGTMTGGTGPMPGGTGTMTGGTGTMTGGTGTMTDGTGTMTGSSSGSCVDKIQTCSAYGTSICSDHSYAKWVESNCCAYCRSYTGGPGTMTGGTGPMPGGTGTMTGGTGPMPGGTGTITGGTGTMTGGSNGTLKS
ncbi:hypothetical protein ACJMK2_009268 [Sinanodonta woodiana]|uniref:VWFC domain-containing protein n=1 Tax=Sinanodonta woodiana TaxID=1069815 RepID=A0ABD3VET2_SINWO